MAQSCPPDLIQRTEQQLNALSSVQAEIRIPADQFLQQFQRQEPDNFVLCLLSIIKTSTTEEKKQVCLPLSLFFGYFEYSLF